MAEGELLDIAVQVLGAHVVIDADVAALKQRPEAFNAIGVRHVADILTSGVIDANVFVARTSQANVATMRVCDDSCARFAVFAREARKG